MVTYAQKRILKNFYIFFAFICIYAIPATINNLVTGNDLYSKLAIIGIYIISLILLLAILLFFGDYGESNDSELKIAAINNNYKYALYLLNQGVNNEYILNEALNKAIECDSLHVTQLLINYIDPSKSNIDSQVSHIIHHIITGYSNKNSKNILVELLNNGFGDYLFTENSWKWIPSINEILNNDIKQIFSENIIHRFTIINDEHTNYYKNRSHIEK